MADPKRCTKCDEHKPRTEFYPHSVSPRGVSAWCRDCTNATTKKAQKTNPEKARAACKKSKLKTKWGMTVAEYDAMLASQGGGCAVCDTQTPGGMGRFPVDHDHKTGRIRGLLCNLCNVGLGHLKDSPELLRKAASYIEQGGHRGLGD